MREQELLPTSRITKVRPGNAKSAALQVSLSTQISPQCRSFVWLLQEKGTLTGDG